MPTIVRTSIIGASISVGTNRYVSEAGLVAEPFSLCMVLLTPSVCGEKRLVTGSQAS